MHPGVRDFIRWLENHRDHEDVELNAPASAAAISGIEHQLGVPLPSDLRFVLTRFNGGELPSGTLLTIGEGEDSIGHALGVYATAVGAKPNDPELILPFLRTEEDSYLAFDRSAAPLSDTWPIVDYYEGTGEVRLVYRTFDGFCRVCVGEWTSPDFDEEFTLDSYLRKGQRHADLEPDVASAHATVAHAFKRAGRPRDALNSYLGAARCVPAIAWCDWEALKLAALLEEHELALEAASRLCSPGPDDRWVQRDTRPMHVADAIGVIAQISSKRKGFLRLLDQLEGQGVDRDHVCAVRHALVSGEELPKPTPPSNGGDAVSATGDLSVRWQQAREAYLAGQLRDTDILLDSRLRDLAGVAPLSQLLHLRREF